MTCAGALGCSSPAPTGSARRSSLSLSQIAARVDQHLGVSKLMCEGILASDVQLIHGEDRVGEIAGRSYQSHDRIRRSACRVLTPTFISTLSV
jgi:hypothetical protein